MAKKAKMTQDKITSTKVLPEEALSTSNEDTMSLNSSQLPEYGEATYMLIERSRVVASENDNPLLIFKKSPTAMKILNFNRLSQLNKIDQVVPLIVKKMGSEYRYLGDIETYREIEKFLSSINRNEVWCVVVGEKYSDSQISKLWAELNLSNPVESPLHRLFLYRYHIKRTNISRKEFKKFMGVGTSNGKEAKKFYRDFSICSSDVLYELVTGIPADKEFQEENYWTAPDLMKSKLSYTQALAIAEYLGGKEEVHQDFKEKLNLWISEAQEMELKSDTVKPLHERMWYHKSKPLEIALGISGEKSLPSKLKFKDQVWSARLVDDNKRILKIPELTIDFKKKDDTNIRLLFDFYIKASSLAQTIKSYLKNIHPVDHGGVARGRAAEDDSSLELRSHMSEFYNHHYLKETFKMFMVRYSNPTGFLNALGLSLNSFGFESPTAQASFKDIRQNFLNWKALNANKFLSVQTLPNVPKDVLSVPNILSKLTDLIDKHAPSDNEELIDFETFFHQIFALTYKELQKDWNASFELTKTGDTL